MVRNRKTPKLPPLAAILLAVQLLVPSAAVAKAIDATNTQHMELPDGVIGPKSIAFDKRGAGPYVSVSEGRVLKYGSEGIGWVTFTYSPSYTKNGRDALSEIPQIVRESSCGRPLGFGSTTTVVTCTLRMHTWIHGVDACGAERR
ncbi:unnamed protein product [Urochloa humidicola]